MKIAQPYGCDAPGCGKRRESDANHWWLVALFRDPELRRGETRLFVNILTWDADLADKESDFRHACGVECALKIAGGLMARILAAPKEANAKSGA